jgi:hypothetical protein
MIRSAMLKSNLTTSDERHAGKKTRNEFRMRAIPNYQLITSRSLSDALFAGARTRSLAAFAGGTDLMVLLEAGKLPHRTISTFGISRNFAESPLPRSPDAWRAHYLHRSSVRSDPASGVSDALSGSKRD